MAASSPDSGSTESVSAPAQPAFAAFYEETSRFAYSLALRITADGALAERACEAAYLNMMSNWGIEPAARTQALLDRVRAHALDLHSLDGRRDAGSTDSKAASYNQQEGLRAAIATLDPRAKRAIECAYFGGLRVTEIAELTGAPVPSVRTLLRQGLLTLARLTRAAEVRP
jgi:RNA polymerase sigma-70 factor (ECF subfamily)